VRGTHIRPCFLFAFESVHRFFASIVIEADFRVFSFLFSGQAIDVTLSLWTLAITSFVNELLALHRLSVSRRKVANKKGKSGK
jgi:hypothetical protein